VAPCRCSRPSKTSGPDHITAGPAASLNGTANFILSRMGADGLGYEHVLAEAQDLGVAEADLTFDVDGTDAPR